MLKFLIVAMYEKNDANESLDLTQEINVNGILSFSKLQYLIQIFNSCPVTIKGFKNNSNQMRDLIIMPGYEDDIEQSDDDEYQP